jgi:TonB family protein
MARLFSLLLMTALLTLTGCATLIGPVFEPYEVYVEALVAEEPETFAPFVREAMAGTVILGDAPAPVEAQYVARLRSHPAGTHLRIERRLTQPGFYDGTQLTELYLDAVQAWTGSEDRYPGRHQARLVPQASATTCITDTLETGLYAPPEPAPEENREGERFRIVEQPPELVGGLEGLQKRLRYPDGARRKGAEGTVTATFIVDEQGDVPCIDIVNGLPHGINQAVLAAIQDSEFRPGIQKDKPVKVRFSLPVKFRLR